jgi:predicted ATP-grasp superfamily ATP-dependent carboligase
MSSALPLAAVVVDFGSASPMSVLAAARGLARVVFVCDRRRPYVRALFDDLAALGTVCDVTDLSDDEIDDHPALRRLDAITTFSENQLVRTAALADRRGLSFLSPAVAVAATDKYRQRELLARAGVQHTTSRVVRPRDGSAALAAALAETGLPAVLKPRSGAASARTCTIHTVDEARARLREFASGDELTEFVVEELLAGDPAVTAAGWGDYVSVESVTSHGHTRHIEITGKFPLASPLRETGYVVPAALDEATRRAALDLTGAALRGLGVRHGASHVELKLTPVGPRIIEVNARVGGYVADLIRRTRGFDLIRAALQAALGQPCAEPSAGYRRYAFQYFVTPPMTAVRLRGVDGVDELLQHRGIHLVEAVKTAGQPVDWRDGTLAYVAIVHGSGADHDEVLRLVEIIRRTLRVEYDE